MISKTFIKETKELLREGRVRISIVIVLLLLGIAVWISSKQYENINDQYAAAKSTERGVWEGLGEVNPHNAAHFGTYAFKPKYPLSLVDQGVDKYAGTSIFLEAHNRNDAQFSAAADQTGLARFGDLTPDFILLFIIPLLIILLGYNSLTKEREMGTLALLKSQGISFWKIILGKWTALFVPILIITVALFLIAGVVLSNLEDYGVFSWSALLVMCLIYVVYYAVFTNLVLLVSKLTRKSGVSLVISLSVWIVACLATPKIATNVANNQYPYPTAQEFAVKIAADKEKGLDGHNPWSEEAQKLEKEILAEYKVDSLNQLPFNFDGLIMQKGEEHAAEVYFKHYALLKEQYEKQTTVYQSLAVLSPYLPTRFMSMAIANTDYGAHWDFSDTAENYRVGTQKFLNDHFAENSAYGDWDWRADSDLWKELPPFEYEPRSLKSTIKTHQGNFGILGGWLLLSFVSLFLTSKRF